MHAGRHYTLKEIIVWTRRETAVFVLLAGVQTALYEVAGLRWLALPWLPIAMIGTAVAFITGFKNNASYSRLWEARQGWGAIVNASRNWALLVLNYVPDEPSRRRLFYRHFAWLTALRYQLREPRSWENMNRKHNVEYRSLYRIAEWEGNQDRELAALLDAAEASAVLAKKNRATHIMSFQSRDVRTSVPEGPVSEFQMIELQRLLASLLDAQGMSERIKNFPYPRQYATLNHLFVWLFILLTPSGLLQEFQKLGGGFVWLTIPASVTVAWVFHTMDKIGEGTENPFEGNANDVPITALSRNIEIEMREMLGESEIPPALQPVHNILM